MIPDPRAESTNWRFPSSAIQGIYPGPVPFVGLRAAQGWVSDAEYEKPPAGQRSTAGVYRNPWQRSWVEPGRSYGFSVRTRNSV